jgi:hypothetical protein
MSSGCRRTLGSSGPSPKRQAPNPTHRPALRIQHLLDAGAASVSATLVAMLIHPLALAA